MPDVPINYVLDANVYITAYQRYYSFDIVESFWKHLVQHAKGGRIVSIDRVKEELEGKGDDLSKWVSGQCSHAFVSTDRPDVLHQYGEMMKWVQRQDFKDYAKAEFAMSADGWIVAYAKAAGHVVVTHEKYQADRKSSVKIPNICRAFSVEYLDTFEMLRSLGVRLG